jgi:succinyl-diaminopimelate desuccinylase
MGIDEVFKAVEDQAGRLERMLVDIIRIDTSVPPGNNYAAMVDNLQPLLEAAGLSCERVLVPEERWRRSALPLEGERVNLIATMSSGKPPLSIYAHMDVVPAGTGWTVDPFAGVVKDGVVFGRGAVDMKGSIPPVVVALEIIRDLGLETRFDPRLLLCTDEELGTDPGALYLAERGYFTAPVLHLEGGAQGPAMFAANAGFTRAQVTSTGREAHSGMSFMGINALEEAVPAIEELMDLKRVVEKRESAFPSLPVPDAPSPWLTPTFNLNIIRAGEKINVLPGLCELQIDRRFIPEEDLEDVKREIEAAVERARGRSRADLAVEFETLYLSHRIDTASEHVARWCEGVRKALGYPDDLEFLFPGMAGATDMSFVARELGTDQFIGTGVADPEHRAAHGPDECVPVANLVNLCKELVYFLVDLDKAA